MKQIRLKRQHFKRSYPPIQALRSRNGNSTIIETMENQVLLRKTDLSRPKSFSMIEVNTVVRRYLASFTERQYIRNNGLYWSKKHLRYYQVFKDNDGRFYYLRNRKVKRRVNHPILREELLVPKPYSLLEGHTLEPSLITYTVPRVGVRERQRFLTKEEAEALADEVYNDFDFVLYGWDSPPDPVEWKREFVETITKPPSWSWAASVGSYASMISFYNYISLQIPWSDPRFDVMFEAESTDIVEDHGTIDFRRFIYDDPTFALPYKYEEGRVGSYSFTELLAVDAKRNAVRNLNERLPNLAVFLGELPETIKMFFEIAAFLAKMMKAIKTLKHEPWRLDLELIRLKREFSSSSRYANMKRILGYITEKGINLDLMWQYGIKPLLSDLHDIANMMDGLSNFRSAKFARSRLKYAGGSVQSYDYGPVRFRDVSGEFEGEVILHIHSHTDVTYSAMAKLNASFTGMLSAFGLTDILGTAWELMPLSFVVDWFVDVGSLASRINNVALEVFGVDTKPYELDHEMTTICSKSLVTGSIVKLLRTPPGAQIKTLEFGKHETFAMERFDYNIDPVTEALEDMFNFNETFFLSTSKLISGAELFIQRLK